MWTRLHPSRHNHGFTLVEALVALLFMSVLLPVLVNAFLTANRAGTVAERSRIAAELADMKLTELLVMDTWRDGDAEGDFADYPGYTWRVQNDGWAEDTMREVTVEVNYMVQGGVFRVVLTTLAEESEL